MFLRNPSKLSAAIFGSLLLSSASLAQNVVSGEALYAAGACATCHGPDGRGTPQAPSIVPRVLRDSDADLITFIRTGNPDRGMPPTTLPADQLPALVDYLRTLARAAELSLAPARSTTTLRRAVENYSPVTEENLLNPPPGDWLSFSRSLDAQRFSPLAQIDAGNVHRLALAWSRGLPAGMSYTIPLVHDGVLYVTTPDSAIQALDATNGDLLWEYRR